MRAGPFICLSAFLWASCSVKEARQDCPCRLEVDLTAFGEVTRQVSLDLDGKALERSLLGPDSLLVRTRVAASDFLDIRVWSGVSRMEARGSLLQVKEGNDGDSLFLFCSRLPGRRESALVKAVPHKQFATVVLQVLPEDLPAGVRFTVRGQYGSFDLDGGQPVAAPLVIPLPEGKAESAFRLPRQEAAGVLVLVLQHRLSRRIASVAFRARLLITRASGREQVQQVFFVRTELQGCGYRFQDRQDRLHTLCGVRGLY